MGQAVRGSWESLEWEGNTGVWILGSSTEQDCACALQLPGGLGVFQHIRFHWVWVLSVASAVCLTRIRGIPQAPVQLDCCVLENIPSFPWNAPVTS